MPVNFWSRIAGLLIWLAVALPYAVRAQNQPYGLALDHFTTEDGLSNDQVNGIAQDRDGFIWFGTQDGLTRYDGRRTLVFRHVENDSTSLPSDVITGLSTDSASRLWVSTHKGLAIYEPVLRGFRRIPFHPPGQTSGYDGFLSALDFDAAGNAWGVCNYYLFRFDPAREHFEFFRLPEGMIGLSNVEVDRKGRVWAVVAGNLLRFDPAKHTFTHYLGRDHPEPDQHYATQAVKEGPDGTIWTSTWGFGFFVYNPTTDRFDNYSDGFDICGHFFFDRHPQTGKTFLWVAGNTYGLYLLHPATMVREEFAYDPREPYAHNNTMAQCFYKDRNTGIVWIGTEKGVEIYDPNRMRFNRILFPEAYKFDQFTAISAVENDRADPDRYWITVWGKGLVEWRRSRNEFDYLRSPVTAGMRTNELFDVIQDRRGRVWLGETGGVSRFDPQTRRFQAFHPEMPNRFINHKVLSLLESRTGRLWCGWNYDGLYELDPERGEWKWVRLAIGGVELPRPLVIRSMVEDRQGRVIAATGNGLVRYDPATGQQEYFLRRTEDILACHVVAFDRQDRLWVATNKGLFRLDSAMQEEFYLSEKNGLANDFILQFQIDRLGNFWLGTPTGLQRYNPSTGRVDLFTKAEGLFENDTRSAAQILPGGELFVGFTNAFNLSDPAWQPAVLAPPRALLDGVQILNRAAPWQPGRPVVLRPGENVVSFEFAVINFSRSEKTWLSYKLQGFDQDWAETTLPTITYTNLDGGRYTLLVRARNGDGAWSEEPARVELVVVPPYYRTWWFRLLLLLGGVGLLLGVVVYRNRQRLELAAIRQRISRDLHDDMGSSLSSIRFFSEVARKQLGPSQPQAAALVERIEQSAAALSDAMQDIVWAIDARHDTLDDLATRIREFGLKIAEARQVRFCADLPAELPDRSLRPDQRRNIYLIFKEAVNNAAKYSGCTEIAVRMEMYGSQLHLEIRDDGQGFDPGSVQYGNGLANLRLRATEIGGRIDVYTRPGEGVRLVLVAPLHG